MIQYEVYQMVCTIFLFFVTTDLVASQQSNIHLAGGTNKWYLID